MFKITFEINKLTKIARSIIKVFGYFILVFGKWCFYQNRTVRLTHSVDKNDIVALAADSIFSEFIGNFTPIGKPPPVNKEVMTISCNGNMQLVAVLMTAAPGPDIKKGPLRISIISTS